MARCSRLEGRDARFPAAQAEPLERDPRSGAVREVDQRVPAARQCRRETGRPSARTSVNGVPKIRRATGSAAIQAAAAATPASAPRIRRGYAVSSRVAPSGR